MIIIPFYRRGNSGTDRKQEKTELESRKSAVQAMMNWESGELGSSARPAICLLQKSSQLSGLRPLLITSLKAYSFELKSSASPPVSIA